MGGAVPRHLALLAVIGLTACSGTSSPPAPSQALPTSAPATSAATGDPDLAAALVATVDGLVMPGYARVRQSTAALRDAVAAACADTDPAAWEAVREPYRTARREWRTAAVYASTVSPAFDFPIAPQKILDELRSDVTIDVELLRRKGSDMKGLRSIELVLFSDPTSDVGRTPPERRCAWATAAAELVAGAGDNVARQWEQGFRDAFLADTRFAYDELVNQLLASIQSTADGPLKAALGVVAGEIDPAARQNPDTMPDRRSLADAVADVESALAVYDALVGPPLRAQAAGTDQRVRALLQDALDTLRSLPGTLAAAIATDEQAVYQAYLDLETAKRSMITEVAVLLGVTIMFNSGDGDS